MGNAGVTSPKISVGINFRIVISFDNLTKSARTLQLNTSTIQQSMKTFLKILGGLFVLLLIAAAAIRLFVHEAEPVGVQSSEADAMVEKMYAAIDKPAWDSTAIVAWNFADRNQYLWDKERHLTRFQSGETVVLLDIKNKTGKAYQAGTEVTGEAARKLLNKTWDNFNNDSFWLNAPAKATDPGTVRSVITDADGRKGLKVEYTSGGTTPGDSYVWFLDENGLPTSYKMWVKIIPVGGVEFGWSDYKTLYSGAKVAQMHKGDAFDLKITDIEAAESFAEMGLEKDPFAEL